MLGCRWLTGYEDEMVGSFMAAELKEDKTTGEDIS